MNKPLNSVLFTHDDLDGAGCRIVYSLAFLGAYDPAEWKIFNCSNSNVDEVVAKAIEDELIDPHTDVYFGDICCSRELLEKLVWTQKCTGAVRVFDHHRTNFWAEMVCGQSGNSYATIVPEDEFKTMQSGTSLLYQYFSQLAIRNPKDKLGYYFREGNVGVPLLAKLVDTIRAYDTWEWKETGNIGAKELQTLFFLLGMDRFCERYISRVANYAVETVAASPDKVDSLITKNDKEFVDARMENERKRIDKFSIDDVIMCYVRGLRTAFAINTTGMNVSELGNQFLTKHPEIDMFAAFSLADNGTYSFRCIRDDLNTGEMIAKPIGGGGHPKASGAPLDKEILDIIADMLIADLNGNTFRI